MDKKTNITRSIPEPFLRLPEPKAPVADGLLLWGYPMGDETEGLPKEQRFDINKPLT